jgi:probable phosphoglycerate mutase
MVVAPRARGSLAGVLILVRHGRTALNAAGRLQGRLDEPLDEVGVAQAAALAEHVGNVDVLISSPLLRAVQTAEAFGADIRTDERWIELSYGEFEGRSIAETPSEAWAQWQQDVHYVPAGGESLATLDARVRAACAEVGELARDADVVVVSHVSPIKSAVAWALDATIAISWRSHLVPASICRIEMRGSVPVLRSFNETAPVVG